MNVEYSPSAQGSQQIPRVSISSVNVMKQSRTDALRYKKGQDDEVIVLS